MTNDDDQRHWTFLTNHALVLLSIARDPEIRMRDIAGQVQVTERAAQRIVAELVEAGYITRERIGRRNRYSVAMSEPLRHPRVQHARVGSLIEMLTGEVAAAS